MNMMTKCPCGNACCKKGTCADCAEDVMNASHEGGCGSAQCGCGRYGSNKFFLKGLLGFLAAVLLFTFILNNAKKYHYIGKAAEAPRLITLSGTGKVTARPDIAVTNVGLITEGADAATAQAENNKKMNGLIAAMQQLGISPNDIQTSQYQISPKYSYDAKSGSNITGYTVSQSIEIKIRDLNKISAVLAKAGESGANNVGGIQFTIDEPSNLRAEAREKAVKDAKEKAAKLADDLGVHLGEVVTFNEFQNPTPGPQPYYAMKDMTTGAQASDAPSIQTGSLEFNSEVTVTYEIK